ncbi:MAG: hypothetical protein UY40_C0017G0002 [candidate division CPR1 bacterium GW2011_GWC1_49_13]|uniref:Uncharacterized protein n=1 Tax=candidate division CPR1 bacterium GW2011_GWC1_49_13 TaxID=1618342 RepID=A0A0G1YGI6_9BACT|nr:MAG: hypothetical protein UY40_C0017G0002 [candidate division CPR1 bacterium GW2011_GWC1_49_13]
MAGEIPLIRMEQGATEMTVPSSCFISVESGGLIEIESGGQVDVAGHVDVESGGYVSLESGGYITAASGSYLTVGTVSTEVAAATLRKFGPVYLDGSSSGAYTLPDPNPGSYMFLFTAGMTTGKEIYIASTAAQFTRPDSTASTGLLIGSTGSTGATSAQHVFLIGLTTALWGVIAKTSGVVYE